MHKRGEGGGEGGLPVQGFPLGLSLGGRFLLQLRQPPLLLLDHLLTCAMGRRRRLSTPCSEPRRSGRGDGAGSRRRRRRCWSWGGTVGAEAGAALSSPASMASSTHPGRRGPGQPRGGHMRQAGRSRLGKALAGQGCTGLSLSGQRGPRGPGLVMPLLCMAEGASKQPCCCLRAALGSPSRPTSLPGRLPGCKGSAGSGSAGDTPSGRGVGRERGGGKQETVREAPHPAGAPPLLPWAGLPSPSPERQPGKRLPKSHHPAELGHGAGAYPSAAGPAGAWSRCPAAWPPGCGAGCPLGSGGPGQDGRQSAAGTGTGAGTGCTGATAGVSRAARRLAPPGSHTLGEGLRPSMERLSCEDEGVPLFIRGARAPASPSVLARYTWAQRHRGERGAGGCKSPPQADGSAVGGAEHPLPRPCPSVGAGSAGAQARGGSGCQPPACCPPRVCSAPGHCGSRVPGSAWGEEPA